MQHPADLHALNFRVRLGVFHHRRDGKIRVGNRLELLPDGIPGAKVHEKRVAPRATTVDLLYLSEDELEVGLRLLPVVLAPHDLAGERMRACDRACGGGWCPRIRVG